MKVPLTPLRFLDRAAKYYPDRPAVICGNSMLNYSEFSDRVNKAANLFSTLHSGRPNENQSEPPRIVFITWNCHNIIEACYGALRAGVIRVPLNVRLTPKEWAEMINYMEASAVVVGSEFKEKLESVREDLITVDKFFVMGSETNNDQNYIDYISAIAESSGVFDRTSHYVRDEHQTAEIFFTSGTTKRSKGVRLSPRNLYMNAVNFFLPLQLKQNDVFLHSLSLFHINGWGALHFMPACGGVQVVMGKFSPESFCELVEKHKVTLSCMVPTMMNMLVNYPDLGKYDLTSLRCIISGGAKLPMALGKEALEKLDCDILGSYGLTEASPVVTFATIQDDKNKSGTNLEDEKYFRQKFSPGIETLDCELRVVDEKGNLVHPDGKAVGEIQVRGNVITDGYWGNEEDTNNSFTDPPENWFRTGDLAVVDDEGYVHIVDRIRDIIIRGGENISSLDIEDVLRSHSSVLEAAVISVNSEKWGEEPLAVVVLKGNSDISESELLDFCKNNMASFKVPAVIRFVDELPKSGTGKILKRDLREMYRKEQE